MLHDWPKRLARRWFPRSVRSEGPTCVETLAIAPHTIDVALALPPRAYEYLRIDVASNCNLACTYCEIRRGKAMLELSQLRAFLTRKVTSVQNVFFGCGTEPTINRQLGSHLAATRELVDPPGRLGLQTNGTLLHRHDLARFRDAGLNTVSLSIDSMRPETMRRLRGTDVHQVLVNLDALQDAIPGLAIHFSVVVSRGNYAEVAELVDFAIDRGVEEVWLRELTYRLDEVPPERAELLLARGAFERLKPELLERSSRIALYFLDVQQLDRTAEEYLDSLEHERPAAVARADCRLQPSARPGGAVPAVSSKVS